METGSEATMALGRESQNASLRRKASPCAILGQLVPELADDMRGREVVVFVDASAMLEPGVVAVRRLAAALERQRAPTLTHHTSPEALLLLAERLYDARPRAFLVAIGAASFALGEDLSPAVAAALPEAAEVVRRLVAAPHQRWASRSVHRPILAAIRRTASEKRPPRRRLVALRG